MFESLPFFSIYGTILNYQEYMCLILCTAFVLLASLGWLTSKFVESRISSPSANYRTKIVEETLSLYYDDESVQRLCIYSTTDQVASLNTLNSAESNDNLSENQKEEEEEEEEEPLDDHSPRIQNQVYRTDDNIIANSIKKTNGVTTKIKLYKCIVAVANIVSVINVCVVIVALSSFGIIYNEVAWVLLVIFLLNYILLIRVKDTIDYSHASKFCIVLVICALSAVVIAVTSGICLSSFNMNAPGFKVFANLASITTQFSRYLSIPRCHFALCHIYATAAGDLRRGVIINVQSAYEFADEDFYVLYRESPTQKLLTEDEKLENSLWSLISPEPDAFPYQLVTDKPHDERKHETGRSSVFNDFIQNFCVRALDDIDKFYADELHYTAASHCLAKSIDEDTDLLQACPFLSDSNQSILKNKDCNQTQANTKCSMYLNDHGGQPQEFPEILQKYIGSDFVRQHLPVRMTDDQIREIVSLQREDLSDRIEFREALAHFRAFEKFDNYHTSSKFAMLFLDWELSALATKHCVHRRDVTVSRCVHSIYLDELKPATEYDILVVSRGGRCLSGMHRYRTLPNTSDDGGNVTIGFLGDIGLNEKSVEIFSSIASATKMSGYHAISKSDSDYDLYVMSGDIAYDNALMSCCYTWDYFFSQLELTDNANKFAPHASVVNSEDQSRKFQRRLLPIVTGIGNHDVGLEVSSYRTLVYDEIMFIVMFPHEVDQESRVPLPPVQRQTYHSHILTNRYALLSLDSGIVSNEVMEQFWWMRREFERFKEMGMSTLATYHYPIFVGCSKHDINWPNRFRHWTKMFNDYRVPLVVEAHEHLAKATYPLEMTPDDQRGNKEENFKGTVYIGNGASGAIGDMIYCDTTNRNHTLLRFVRNERHFWTVRLSQDELQFILVINQQNEYEETISTRIF